MNTVILPFADESETMNQADNDRIHELCSLIAVEQDRQKFLQLVQELNDILSNKEKRLEKNELSHRKGD